MCPAVDDLGRYTDDLGPELRGKSVLGEANALVIEALRQTNSIMAMDPAYRHRYPYDWRTKKPVIIRSTQQWFAKLDGGLRQRAASLLDPVCESGRRDRSGGSGMGCCL